MAVLNGVGVSHGISIGQVLRIGRWELDVPHYRIGENEVRSELRRLLRARRRARDQILELRDRTANALGKKYAAIFDAHLLMLDDRDLGRRTSQFVRERLMNAEWALASSVQHFLDRLQAVDDEYLRERGGDLQDIHLRLQRVLAGETHDRKRMLDLTEDTVIVANALSPSDAIWLHQPHIVGFVTEEGGKTSHTAILANALEVPAVLGIDGICAKTSTGDTLVVDGAHGRVVVRPSDEQLRSYGVEREKLQQLDHRFEEEKGPVFTADGVPLKVAANVEFPDEMRTVARVGADGVGLYRSEFLFLTTSPELPTLDDHLEAYRQIAGAADGASVIIRTFDLGGEKYFHRVLDSKESNPVLGMRAVRFGLAHPEILRTQMRALLIAAAETQNVWILVPMISGVEEWRQVKDLIAGERERLEREGVDVPDVPLGCMIEVPSAALIADHLAAEADFFSIGTNDLMQYTLAVDRGNRAVGYLNDPWHPGPLRLMSSTMRAAREAEIPVSLCGELASDPLGAITLLGLGLRHFSCNPIVVPEIRTLLRKVSAESTTAEVRKALQMRTGDEIRAHLIRVYGPLIEQTLGPDLLPSPPGAHRLAP